MKSTEVIHAAPPASFKILVEQTLANKKLSQYLHFLIDFPEHLLASYQLVPTREQREFINEIKHEKFGMVAWLAHLWFNRGRKIPNDLSNTCLLAYRVDALLSDALLKLAEATCESSDLLLNQWDLRELGVNLDNDDKPGWLWFLCELGKWYIRIEDSGLGLDLGIPELSNPIKMIGKVKILENAKDFIDLLEGIAPAEFTDSDQSNSDPWSSPQLLLLSEAQKIAESDDDFARDYWEPYLKLFRRWTNEARKNKYVQAKRIRSDGSTHTTGKHHRIPKGFA